MAAGIVILTANGKVCKTPALRLINDFYILIYAAI